MACGPTPPVIPNRKGSGYTPQFPTQSYLASSNTFLSSCTNADFRKLTNYSMLHYH